MPVTELVVLELHHPWEHAEIQAFFQKSTESQSSWSGYPVLYFQGADSPNQIILVSGWEAVQTHHEWVAERGQELVPLMAGRLEFKQGLHLDVDFNILPKDATRFAVEFKKENGESRSLKSRSAAGQSDLTVSGKVLDGAEGETAFVQIYTAGETDRLVVA